MEIVQIGQTDLMVSTLCFGAMYLGTKQNKEESFRLLDQFTAAGGNFIDSANIYAHWIPGGFGGESETILGSWIKERVNRDKVYIATKVGFGYQDVQPSLRAEVIEEECNKSLTRLGIDTIDLYYAHNDDRSTPLEETLEAFYRLKKKGKIRYIGASNYLAWRLEESRCICQSNDWPEYCCIQQRHSYLRKKPGTSFDPQVAANDDLMDYCRNRDIQLIAYSALLGGVYTRDDVSLPEQYHSTDTNNRLKGIRSVSSEIGATQNQVVLAWMLKSDPFVLPLVAASSTKQMEENIGALEVNLSFEQMERLTNAGP
jgi:aryl-alcohol dehydrogenase-like predicted oxidoreductase